MTPSAPATFVQADPDSAAKFLTSSSAAPPRTTFPLILASVTVAVLALHIDLVARYSREAFWLAVLSTVALAWGVARLVALLPPGMKRTSAALALPTIGGAIVGVVVQTLVLVGADPMGDPVRDLGGLIDTTQPIAWIAGGIVLGGVPAIGISLFLVLAGRALKKLTGHDASEGFSVAFTGACGLFAAFGLVIVESWEAAPLVIVVATSFVALVVALVVDGARLRFLRQAWAGGEGAFEVMDASSFTEDSSLVPVVAQGGKGSVLVKVDRRPGSYRGAAAVPLALLGTTEQSTTFPLRRRRAAAAAMLVAMTVLASLAMLAHVGVA